MKTKAHLVFPQEILDEVDQIAGKRKRSMFIVKTTQEKLERERFLDEQQMPCFSLFVSLNQILIP